jgi:MoaA/NifB/PqqE/SkfB family radical SAM enzyme
MNFHFNFGGKMPTKKTSIEKLFNKRMVQLQAMALRNPRVIGMPFSLVLESGNVCNLRCPLCPTPVREKGIPKGVLSYEKAKKVIDEMPFLIDLNLSLWGEPFLNGDIFKIVSYAEKNGIETLVKSNLNRFNDVMAEKLIDSRLSHLMISLDGASQATYEKYRIGGDFAKVIQNIELLLNAQKKRNDYKTKITWKMVVNKFNENEVKKASLWAGKLGVEFRTVEIYTPPKLSCEWKPKKILTKSENVYTDRVQLCHSLWQTMVVNFDGNVFPCCSEWSPKDAIGNVFSESIDHIWNNERYKSLRKSNRKNLDCEACHEDKGTKWYRLWRA